MADSSHPSSWHSLRLFVWAPTLILSLLMMPLAPLVAQVLPPQIFVTPGATTAGGTVTLSANGFPPGSTGQVLWDDGTWLGTFTADAAGSFVVDLVAPASVEGAHTILAATEDGTASAQTTLVIEAAEAPTAVPTDPPPPTEPAPTEAPPAPPPTDAAAQPTPYPIVGSGHSENSPDAGVVFDNDLSTFWITDPVTPDEAWVVLDLGAIVPISSVRWQLATEGTMSDLEILLSEDGITWASLVTLDGTAMPAGVLIEQPVNIWARFVQLKALNPAGLAQLGGFAEVEVWPASEARPISAIITPEPVPTLEPDAAVPTQEPAVTQGDVLGTGIIASADGAGVDCRLAPNVEAGVITVLPSGSVVDITGPALGEWIPVTCGGQAGFVSAQFVTAEEVADPEPSQAPATPPPTDAPPVATPDQVAPLVATPEKEAASVATPVSGNARVAAALPGPSLSLPLRGAFYYPWYPRAWDQNGVDTYTDYQPSAGYYDSNDAQVVAGHIAGMQYGNIDVGIASWWGPGSYTDQRLPTLLAAASGTGFTWTVYYEAEGYGNPTASTIRSDLEYLRDTYASDPSYLRIDGRFVVFVYGGSESCGMVDRWSDANATVGAFIVLKAFTGYQGCASQPDSWHQYGPSMPVDSQGQYSFTISPGFDKYGEDPRLIRDIDRWREDVSAMVASGADWQLVSTFNEWGEGTAVESAVEWETASGYGAYLDVLHSNGGEPTPPTPAPTEEPSPTPTATSPAPTPTPPALLTFAPIGDAEVREDTPNTNYPSGTKLRVDEAPMIESYLLFNVTGLPAPIQHATLRLWVIDPTVNAPPVYLVEDTSWTERGITWANRPDATSPTDDKGAVPVGVWLEYDVTSLISGNGLVSFALITESPNGVHFSSREATENQPQLVIGFDDTGPVPTTPPEPTQPAEPTPTATPTPRPSPTPSPAPRPSPTPNLTPVPSPTVAPTTTPSPTPAPTLTPSPRPSPTPTSTSTPSPTPSPTQPPTGGTAILLAAGDISTCSNDGDEQTARILDREAGTIATLGDNAYESGTAQQFRDCYDPTWGRHKDRTYPAPGNHDYNTSGAGPYYDYFGPAAGPAGQGYYSYDLGTWHIVSLNSEIDMSAGSAQERWLRGDLAANPATCTLAYWHKPLFSSSSTHGSQPASRPLFQALYDEGAEIVLVGHDHTYERFAPQTPGGQVDSTFGIREFVVGTGGRSAYDLGSPEPNSEVRNSGTLGVIKLTLAPDSYSWQFLPVAGMSFTDSGSGRCHGAPGNAAFADVAAERAAPLDHAPVALANEGGARRATGKWGRKAQERDTLSAA